MLKYTFLLGLIMHSLYILGQYPGNIHNADLRVWLKSNLYDGEFSDLGYSGARQQMFSNVDEVNGKIQCIYTDFEMNAEFTTFPNPINTEHIIPQSFYGSVSPMRSDLHNLRPSHQNANSARASFDFMEINDSQATWYGINSNEDYVSLNNEPSASSDFSEGTTFGWEPQEDRKGDVARAVFYFYTMYPTQAGSITDLANVNMLYNWHLSDPVDTSEITRNNRAENAQGNRNPYVDNADLAFDAWLWVEILGCTDSTANNFNAQANTNDGSCEYGTLGCTDPTYVEYSPEADVDDGSCVTLVVLGCIYENALNYNPLANRDVSGSCVFAEECGGDYNSDGNITASDLTSFLAEFGGPCLQ